MTYTPPESSAAGTPKPIDVSPASFKKPAAPARTWETAVFFAGFGSVKCGDLESLAEQAGWQVRGSITKTVDYVVEGSRAGSAQLAVAEKLGVAVIDEDTFRAMV